MQITTEDIRALHPCYDPENYIPKDWSGTVIDILELEEVQQQDRLWVATRFVDIKLLKIFAIDLTKRLVEQVRDERIRTCAVVMDRFLTDGDAGESARHVVEGYERLVVHFGYLETSRILTYGLTTERLGVYIARAASWLIFNAGYRPEFRVDLCELLIKLIKENEL